LCPEGDFVDADDAHNVSLVKHRFQFETYFRLFVHSLGRSIEIRVMVRVFEHQGEVGESQDSSACFQQHMEAAARVLQMQCVITK
jgi:hypothetical protein